MIENENQETNVLVPVNENIEQNTVNTNTINEEVIPVPMKNKKSFFQKYGKKKVIFIIVLLVIIIGVFIFSFSLKPKKTEKEPDYTIAMNQYGDLLTLKLEVYKEQNKIYPKIDFLMKQNQLDKYKIDCEIAELYENGTIYLDHCSINNSEKQYSYGKKYEIEKSFDEIMKEYGDKKLEAVAQYIKKNGSLPNQKIAIEYSNKVTCEKEVYYDAENIYLGKCSIDGSSVTYSYGALLETGKITVEDNGTEYTVLCKSASCRLYDKFNPYIIVDDGLNGYQIFNYKKNEFIYSVPKDYQVSFAIYQDHMYYNPHNIILKNSKNEEAFYNLEKKEILFDYGKYKYDWNNCQEDGVNDDKKTCLDTEEFVKIYSNNKAGIANYITGDIVLSPSKYTDLKISNYIILTILNGKMGAIYYDKYSENPLTTILEPELYDKVERQIRSSSYLTIYQNGKAGLLYYDSKKKESTILIKPEIYDKIEVYYDSIHVHQNGKVGLLYYDVDKKQLMHLIELGIYDDILMVGNDIYIYKNEKAGLIKYNKNGTLSEEIVKCNEYERLQTSGEYIYALKNNEIYLLDGSSGKILLGGKSYKAIAPVKYSGGRALVYNGKSLQLIDFNGNLIENLTEIDSSRYSLYYIGDDVKSVFPESYGSDSNSYIKFMDKTDNDCVEFDYDHKNGTLDQYEDVCLNYMKPVLYLYPKQKTTVNVTFRYPNMLTTTYPKYKNGWNVIANPNGDLYDLNNQYYYALYWEESGKHKVNFDEGFYVTSENSIEFLEEKLTQIGLNDKEKNEFIMYWLPILESNKKNLVYFELTEEREKYSPLYINPKPDSILRMAIHVKKVNSYTSIKEQKLPRFERKGFTAVEWGGVIY